MLIAYSHSEFNVIKSHHSLISISYQFLLQWDIPYPAGTVSGKREKAIENGKIPLKAGRLDSLPVSW